MEFFKPTLRLSRTASVMCAVTGALFLLLLALGLLVIHFVHAFERPLPYTVGLLTGCLLSAVKVVLLEKVLERSLDLQEEKPAKNYAHLQSLLRYLLTIVVLLSVVAFPRVFGLWGMIVGVLSLQASAYISGMIVRRMPTV